MKGRWIVFLILLLGAGGGAFYGYQHGLWRQLLGHVEEPARKKTLYHCPMHPQYMADQPGDCPICGMRLVPVERAAAKDEHAGHSPAEAGADKARKILYYVDPMNPQNRSDKPGKAPDGMDLVPVYADEASPETAAAPPGYVPVKITPEQQQMMGITLDDAQVMELDQSIRTVGRVAYDETRLHHVHTKFEGFIEELFVNYVGQFVKPGDPLFSVYSPELVATQNEYLLALRAKEKIAALESDTSLSQIDLLALARRRLALWDIGADEIARLEKIGQPLKAVVIRSPVSGCVIAKNALQGTKIMPTDSLYDIVDLSLIWVLADVYEVNLPLVRVGQPAEMTLAYQPGQVWKGKVTYLYPTVDEKTRTVKARLEFPNPSGRLKPGMYTDVVLKSGLGRALVVPESAVLSTGERMIVFVAKGGGVFEPRAVTTGVKIRNFYEVKSGVAAGDKVVTGANFLLDSESKLKASLSGMGGGHKHGQ